MLYKGIKRRKIKKVELTNTIKIFQWNAIMGKLNQIEFFNYVIYIRDSSWTATGDIDLKLGPQQRFTFRT